MCTWGSTASCWTGSEDLFRFDMVEVANEIRSIAEIGKLTWTGLFHRQLTGGVRLKTDKFVFNFTFFPWPPSYASYVHLH